MDQPDTAHNIKLTIVYGTNKPLEVTETETIDAVKVAAMGLFGIAASEKGSFILKAKLEGTETQLDEAQTVAHYKLHNEQKITLAAGTPYGNT